MKRFVIAAALATAIAGPAFAQAVVTEYYVVQDTATKKCTIVDKKPTVTTTVVVGPAAFKTRLEAYKAQTATLTVTDGTNSTSSTGGAGLSLAVGAATASAYRRQRLPQKYRETDSAGPFELPAAREWAQRSAPRA